jgi:YggT family protein
VPPAPAVTPRADRRWAELAGDAASGLAPSGAAPILRAEPQGVLGRLQGSMIAITNLINTVITILIWLLVAQAVLSWLVAFNVVNTRNRAVYTIGEFLHRITEPMLRPIRGVLPSLGGIDISPVVLILALVLIRDLVNEYLRY